MKAERLTIKVKWEGVEDPPIPTAVNITHVQSSQHEEVILNFGHIAPLLAGGEEFLEQERQRLATDGVIAKIVGRFSLPPSVVKQLLQQLKDHVEMEESGE